MIEKRINTKILQRIDNISNWESSNPVLSAGEIAFVRSDNEIFMKVGNGIAYSETPFYSNIKIDNNRISALNINHISMDEYASLISSNKIDDTTLYIVSSDYFDNFGETIKNIADPIDETDAVNKRYVDELSVNLKKDIKIPTKTSELTNDSDFTTNAELNKVKNITNNLSNELETKSTVSIDGVKSDLSVVHIAKDDYHDLVVKQNIDSSTLYIVSSDNLNAYGEKITNVLSGEDDNDATNIAQVKHFIAESKKDTDENINLLNEIVENKIFIDDHYTDLSIIRIDAEEYHNLVKNEQINSDIVYIVSSDNINAYGERIENVGAPISVTDATNKEYVDNLSVELTEKIDNIEIPKNLSEFENDLNLSKVLIDGENIEEFNVKHISQEEYHELVLSENGIDKDTLYVVSSDTLNAYGEQIKNVAPGVENTDAVNVEQLSAVEQKIEKLNQLHDFQVIRPDFDQSINIRMYIYSNQEMDTPILSVDSGVVPEYFAAFFNNSEITYWIAPSENGFTAEFSNRPVLVKLSNIIKDHELEYSRLFITYEWYYKTDDDIHISDKYSIVVPSYTEVGANASDYVSKKQFEELKQDFRKESAQSQLQEDDMFVCYSNKTNILSGYQNGEVDLILDDFDKSNQYDIKFKTGTQPVKFKFHYEDFNGIQFGEWNINSGYEFPENSDYMIKIRQDMMEVVDGQYPLKEYGYKLVVGELTGNNKKLSCQIENRTITTLNLDSSDLSVTIKLPEKKYSGYARDFILRMNVTELPCIIWDGIDDNWEASDNDWMNLEVGQNVISFTEMG